jgi:hypothetical protein
LEDSSRKDKPQQGDLKTMRKGLRKTVAVLGSIEKVLEHSKNGRRYSQDITNSIWNPPG